MRSKLQINIKWVKMTHLLYSKSSSYMVDLLEEEAKIEVFYSLKIHLGSFIRLHETSGNQTIHSKDPTQKNDCSESDVIELFF